ncbi:MAG: aspartate/tyrosine/aromatic aminotransferase [Kiritimatiellae bacterium]|nr:aspartate/tyrosine/aromatic aminotransferase [Kiritimatiellia bacterium]
MFRTLPMAPADPILGLTDAFHADPDPTKVNLGVGVYQDEQGATPALPSVKAAETAIVASETTKAYLPITGRPEFARKVEGFALGEHPALAEGRVQTAYAPGGTGALRMGAELLRMMRADGAVWVSTPTWPNHKGIFAAAGMEVREYPYFDPSLNRVDRGRLLDTLEQVPAGDTVVLHACCHNPTGTDLTMDDWSKIADCARRRGWTPFLDAAYLGFGDGIEADRRPLALWLDAGVDALIAISFSKNMGLYRERAGALTLIAGDSAEAARATFSHLKRVIRVIFSNAVGHASLTVERVLTDAMLRSLWLGELNAMCERIHRIRGEFAEGLQRRGAGDFEFIRRQKGIFGFSGLTPAQVEYLRTRKHIYMTSDGRINVAGLSARVMDPVCDAIAEALRTI